MAGERSRAHVVENNRSKDPGPVFRHGPNSFREVSFASGVGLRSGSDPGFPGFAPPLSEALHHPHPIHLKHLYKLLLRGSQPYRLGLCSHYHVEDRLLAANALQILTAAQIEEKICALP